MDIYKMPLEKLVKTYKEAKNFDCSGLVCFNCKYHHNMLGCLTLLMPEEIARRIVNLISED